VEDSSSPPNPVEDNNDHSKDGNNGNVGNDKDKDNAVTSE